MTDSEAILQQLAALTADVRSIRTDLDVTFKRMAAMQAELDLLPTARHRRRDAIRSPSEPPTRSGGNGHG